MTTGDVRVIPIPGLPEIAAGDDLAALLCEAETFAAGDIVVVAQKVVSKAEGAFVQPVDGESLDDARRRIAHEQAIEIVADSPWALIVRTATGLVCANAGVDASNVGAGRLTLLPADPDASAARLRAGIRAHSGVDVAVVISDTFGRPWREGQTDVAIGVAGLEPIRDQRGGTDRHGLPLSATQTALADELAAAADLVRAKADGVPAVVIRGASYVPSDTATSADLVRPAATDLFRRGRGMLASRLVTQRWPTTWAGGMDDATWQSVMAVAPSAQLLDAGTPATVRVDDGFEAGLAAAVLADADWVVRWHNRDGAVILEGGRPAPPR